MIIHVVQPGETIDSIAITYDIPVQYLIKENELAVPTNLAVGQTIVILYPEKTYTVQENDTLESIASTHDITIMELYRNNPYLADREFIYPGETIVIRYKTEKTSRISTNGYAFPYIDINVLKKTLPLLTYLTIYNYQVTNDGDLINIQDEEIIKIAKEYDVAPIMLLSTLVENDNTMDHNILTCQSLQNRLIQNILYVLERKGYYGLTIDSQFIVSDDRQLYVDFIENITTQMNQKGYVVFTTLTPSTVEISSGIIYPGLDYEGIGHASNGTILFTYEWARTSGLPWGLISFNALEDILVYSLTRIPKSKISIGVPTIGYVLQLPYIECVSRRYSISYTSAVNLAIEHDSTIYYDASTLASFFTFNDNSNDFMVWFKDARSVYSIVSLVPVYN